LYESVTYPVVLEPWGSVLLLPEPAIGHDPEFVTPTSHLIPLAINSLCSG
jgi:hypothetical protein